MSRSEVTLRIIELPAQVQHQIDDGEHVILYGSILAKGKTYRACVLNLKKQCRALWSGISGEDTK